MKEKVLLCIALVMFCFPVFAQPGGVLSGRVSDKNSGDPLIGATILLKGTDRGAVSDMKGEYELRLDAGTHTLRVSFVGYVSEEIKLNMSANQRLTQNFELTMDLIGFDQVIVTGSQNPYDKIQSSVAVSTISPMQRQEYAPLNTADLMNRVPGFFAESSGGEVGNNLFVRGIPQGGSFRYVTMWEDGLPLFEAAHSSFGNIDLMMRIDETVGNVEVVRGGSASIYASNAPGGIIHFRSNTGNDQFEGLVKTTVGDFGMFRSDINVGGPIDENWRFNIGGFYRTDDGVRDPGFSGANRGGQIKANLTRLFDKGYARVYYKHMDDRNIFYLPMPLQNPGNPEGIPGVDPNYGTMSTNDVMLARVPLPFGGEKDLDLTDGAHTMVNSITGEIYYELGDGWSIKNLVRFSDIDINYNSIFSLDNPLSAIAYAEAAMGPVEGAAGYRYKYTTSGDVISNPAMLNDNGMVIETGWWNVGKPMQNFTNLLQLTRDFEVHSLTAGVYFSEYKSGESRSFHNILTEVKDQPRLLDLMLLDESGNDLVSVTHNGFSRYGAAYRNAYHYGRLISGFITDEWQVSEAFRLDMGFRYEFHEREGQREGTRTMNLGNETTLADNRYVYGNGIYNQYGYDYHEWALSVGANYSLSNNMAFFGRGSRGFKMADFGAESEGTVQAVYQAEGGVKYSSGALAVFGAVFYSRLNNIPFEATALEGGELITLTRFANSETIGTEIEMAYQPLRNLRIDLIATLQDPRFRNYEAPKGYDGQDFSGNIVRRVPRVLINFMPSYNINKFRVFGNLKYFGDRYTDDANNVVLPAFAEVNAGMAYQFTSSVMVMLNASNIFNAVGLTEGNPRVGQIVGEVTDIYMARPILGRAFRLSATYKF
jgi:outer membrane receptor protein involved in Fe transport